MNKFILSTLNAFLMLSLVRAASADPVGVEDFDSNQPNFPSTILRPGDTCQTKTIFRFSAKN